MWYRKELEHFHWEPFFGGNTKRPNRKHDRENSGQPGQAQDHRKQQRIPLKTQGGNRGSYTIIIISMSWNFEAAKMCQVRLRTKCPRGVRPWASQCEAPSPAISREYPTAEETREEKTQLMLTFFPAGAAQEGRAGRKERDRPAK